MHYTMLFNPWNVIKSEPSAECDICVGGVLRASGLGEYLALNEFYQVLGAVKVHLILLTQRLLILVLFLMEYLQ